MGLKTQTHQNSTWEAEKHRHSERDSHARTHTPIRLFYVVLAPASSRFEVGTTIVLRPPVPRIHHKQDVEDLRTEEE